MSKNIIRSSKSSPCPVCNRIKDGDCSWYPDGETVMCKTYSSGIGHDESKWHYIGTNELGFQGKFVLKKEQEFIKSSRPKSSKDYDYLTREGSNLVRVSRTDDGSGLKKFYQSHWDGGKWINGNPNQIKPLIPIYRYADVSRAIERNEQIFIVEGESAADALWQLGIAATTTIGGSGGYSNYGNYQEDLKGARLVLSPDRDELGIKYMSNFERDFSSQIEGWYLAGSLGLWQNPQGGMDIGDDITDYKYTKEQILAKVITETEYKAVGRVTDTPSTVPTCRNLKLKLVELLDRHLPDSDLELELIELAKVLKSSVAGLKVAIKAMLGERDREEQRPDVKQEIDRISLARSARVDIGEILPPSLAKPIRMLAASLGHNHEPYILYLLAGVGGVLHSQSCIRIRSGYEQPANLYGGVVAVSGSKKSPVQRQMLTKPLSQLQLAYNQKYERELAEYERKLTEWEGLDKKLKAEMSKPIPPHHHMVYASSITMEAIESAAAKQPGQSAIYIKDELKAIFQTANQYRKGDDIQNYLSYYDGQQLNKARSGSFISSDHDIKFVMMGTIQPSVLASLAKGENDDDGLMSRFMFANLERHFVPFSPDGGVDVVDLIADIYRQVHALPATTYKFSPSAVKVFGAEFDRYERSCLDLSLKGWERNVWGKAGGQLARLILNLHLIWGVAEGGIPTETIQPEIVDRAILLTRYFIGQAIGIIADQSQELSPQLAKILDLARAKGSTTTREVMRVLSGKQRKVSSAAALELLRELETMNYGCLSQKGRSYIFTPIVGNVGRLSVTLPTVEDDIYQHLQPIVGNVGDFSHLSIGIDSEKNPESIEVANLRSMAESLGSLSSMAEDEAIDALDALYQVWKAPEMTKASEYLKRVDSKAFNRVSELVAKRKASQIEIVDDVENNNSLESYRHYRQCPENGSQTESQLSVTLLTNLPTTDNLSTVDNSIDSEAQAKAIVVRFQEGDLVKPSDSFHERGQDTGIIEAIEGNFYQVAWDSDGKVRRYTVEELEVAA
jgi:hypothetical protein